MNFIWAGSPNFGLPRGTRGQLTSPEAIVYHIAQGTMAGMDAWFNNPASGASSHFGVSRAGAVHQYVRIADASWANGEINRPDLNIPWLKYCVNHGINPNLRTITIEHEGYTGKPWPEAQYQASLALTRWILETLNLESWLDQNLDHRFIGHCRIDSVNRARCPGTGWPRSRLFTDLQQQEDDNDMDEATVRKIVQEEMAKPVPAPTGSAYLPYAEKLPAEFGGNWPTWSSWAFIQYLVMLIRRRDLALAAHSKTPHGGGGITKQEAVEAVGEKLTS